MSMKHLNAKAQKKKTMPRHSEYVKDIYIEDPKTGAQTRIEIYRDPSTSKLFGVDGDYIEDVFRANHSESIDIHSLYSNTKISISPLWSQNKTICGYNKSDIQGASLPMKKEIVDHVKSRLPLMFVAALLAVIVKLLEQ